MQLTPHRAELVLEALQLREFGYTQQQIADTLSTPAEEVPQQTISYWLKHFGNGTIGDVGKYTRLTNRDEGSSTNIKPLPITLFPCKYEELDGQIPSGSIDLILTDPPYLVSSGNMSRSNQADLQRDFGDWDNISQVEYEKSVSIWATLMAKQLKEGGSLYLFIGYRQSFLWSRALEQAGLSYNGILIWHRTNPAPQIRKTRWCPAFDMILFYSKGTPHTFRWVGQNEMHSVIRCGNPEIEGVWAGGICAGDEREGHWHPTQKPRWLLTKLIFVGSIGGASILDPFAGSGSTAFASLHLPELRQITLIEPEPQYVGLIQSVAKKEFECQVILKRNG